MPFLRSLPPKAALLDVFAAFPATSIPLIDYHEALMRGDSPLDVADRELIALFVSGLNACDYCHGVHRAAAREFGLPADVLQALLDDIDSAPVEARLRPILRYVRKLTLTPARMTQSDAEAVFAAGWDDRALYDAISVCALFNMMNRLVDGLGLVADEDYARMAGRRLHAAGYAGLKKLLDRRSGVDSPK